MLYHLFKYLDTHYDIPGAGLFQFLTFRAAFAIILSLIITIVFGKPILKILKRYQVGESIRDLGLSGQREKEGTPTMGGLMILAAIVIPTVLFADLTNIYIQLMLLATMWMGFIGFIDDYIKVFKKDKRGLAGKFKVVGQVGLSIIIGAVIYLHDDITVRHEISKTEYDRLKSEGAVTVHQFKNKFYKDIKELSTTIPFLKNHELNYERIIRSLHIDNEVLVFVFFLAIVTFIVAAVSNGANITDGLDGLATGISAIVGATLLAFAYVSGNLIFSDYLNIMFIPHTGELVVFAAAFVGACIGFLWFNAYPAEVFMGDTGSLSLGGIIAALAIILRKELLIPILCGIFLVENLSVIIQVSWFKYTKRKYGVGNRIFLMAPLHHHYQKMGMNESKIVSRFWIVGILLAVLTIVTLKIR
jgi:phospho-N-acetylmuramoyl-pentapeptide-transferase